jgi:hypothetical protein
MKLTDEELQILLNRCESIKVDCDCEWANCKTCRAIEKFKYMFDPRDHCPSISAKYKDVNQRGHIIVAELIREVIASRKNK